MPATGRQTGRWADGRSGGIQDGGPEGAEKRPPALRVKDHQEFVLPQPTAAVERQASRCMDCGVPFCGSACPLGNPMPAVSGLVRAGHWQRALALLHSTNNFPELTGRLCPALCEAACSLGLISEPVCNRELELSVVERGFREGWVQPLLPRVRSGRKVAVVGSGPAGLACAQQLARSGHAVDVLERHERIGGLLALGIPDYKLDKGVLDRRLAQLAAEGVRFRTGITVGRDLPAEDLVSDYDAVCLAGGATVPRDLDVRGRRLKGIHFAMDYLMQQNRLLQGMPVPDGERISADGRRVVIVGGGDTGADCLGIALRQGAASVVQLEMLPEPPRERDASMPWPEWPRILRTNSAHEEGGSRQFAVSAQRFTGEGGAVRQVHCVRLQWEPGGASCAEVPDSGFVLEADLVLLAMGFLHPEQALLVKGLGLALDGRGNVATDEGARPAGPASSPPGMPEPDPRWSAGPSATAGGPQRPSTGG